MNRPLAIDLFTGLHGWAEGLIDAGWRVIGFDLVDMSKEVGHPKPDHFDLVVQDVLTIHGSQLKSAQLIVSSSPCTQYSYFAMPWSRAKAKATAIRADETGEEMRKLNALYDAQFRIQREASEAAGRHIPMIVENVRGAQPWVGRAVDSYGSYYLWGDVPLIPSPIDAVKIPGQSWSNFNKTGEVSPHWRMQALRENDGRKVPGFRFDGSGGSFQAAAVMAHVEGQKHRDADGYDRSAPDGVKPFGWKGPRTSSGAVHARKAASAKIAKIPLTLSRHIGQAMHPQSTNRFERPRQVNLFGDWLND